MPDGKVTVNDYKTQVELQQKYIDNGDNTHSIAVNATESNPIPIKQIQSPFNVDAWGRPKFVQDYSLLHGLFTDSVPEDKWKELIDDVEQNSFLFATSQNGKLNLTSTVTLNQKVRLSTFRHPRYQPNRGHIYSPSIFLKNKELLGSRKVGYFTQESGAYFELDNGILYAVVRTKIDGLVSEQRDIIDLTGTGIDIEKGNIYDIQMQWRGVGNYKYFINGIEVYVKNYLGTLTQLSMFNPACPLSFECVNKGDVVIIECGCVDVSSEGGTQEGGSYGSIGLDNQEGQIAISGFNVPVIAVKSVDVVNGNVNTRDTLALLVSAYGDQRCIFRVWATRDLTAITENDQVWKPFRDGHLEYIEYDLPNVANPMTFDTSKAQLVFTSRTDQDQTYATSALFEGRANVYQTPGDMFIFTMHRETGGGANVGITYEFSEEI